jgi:hypothetical protein
MTRILLSARRAAACPVRCCVLLVVVLLSWCASVLAWGPHPQITQAALAALGADSPLARRLGPELDRLPLYCWMADWQRSLIISAPGGPFYADDFLLFPKVNEHFDHESPGVERSYRPFLHRVVQAIRTETPANAARWIGSLLHYVEDSGSPPHTLRTAGTLHTKMENWVDASRIKLGGYRPRSLGTTEDEAADGLVRRMSGLIAYSRERGERLRPLAEADRRKEAEPIVLESALETSRVVADLLLTLGQLSAESVPDTAELRGTITSAAASVETPPAKIILEGTDYSTLADPKGAYAWRNLPAGDYRLIVIRGGSEPVRRSVRLAAGQARVEDVALPASEPPGNLVRDPSFSLHWARPATGDGWYRVTSEGSPAWQSETVPVQGGQRYRLAVRWKPGATGLATLFWDSTPPRQFAMGTRLYHYYTRKTAATPALKAGGSERVFTAPEGARSAAVLFEGAKAPATLCEAVSLTPEPSNDDHDPSIRN